MKLLYSAQFFIVITGQCVTCVTPVLRCALPEVYLIYKTFRELALHPSSEDLLYS
jgi:hypothetical protein